MTIWKLEFLRLYRTKRWAALLAVFVVIGLLGPVVAFLLPRVLPHITTGVLIVVPAAHPITGVADFATNATQLGMLFTIIIASGVVAIDANPGISVFYRSRRFRTGNLLFPRYLVITGASIIALFVGTIACWFETVMLLGPISFASMMEGFLLEAIYLAFAIALVAVVAAILKHIIPTIATSIVILLLIPALAIIPHAQATLPSTLLGGYVDLIKGTSFGTFSNAGGLTVAATLILLFLAVFFTERPQAIR